MKITRKVRNRGDALATTRDARATQNAPRQPSHYFNSLWIVTGSNMMAVFSFFRRSLRLEHHRMRMQTTAGSSTPFDWDGQRMPGASPVHLHDNRRGSPADQSIALRSIGKVEAQMWSD